MSAQDEAGPSAPVTTATSARDDSPSYRRDDVAFSTTAGRAEGALRFYQRWISPPLHVLSAAFGIFPAGCRYQPTCSDYAREAIAKHGTARGSWLAAKRILRCHPGSRGGFDPVP